MKVKYSLVVLFLSLLLFVVGCFSAIGTTYAYTSLPVMNKSIKFEYNWGYSSFAFNNSVAHSFSDLTICPNYDNTFLSFLARFGLDFTDVNSLDGVTGYVVTPIFQCRNEYYALGDIYAGTNGYFDNDYYYYSGTGWNITLNNLTNNFLVSRGVSTRLYNYNRYDEYINSFNAFGLRYYNAEFDKLSKVDILYALTNFTIASVEIGSSKNWSYGNAYGDYFISGHFNYVIYRDINGWSYCCGLGSYLNDDIWLWDYRYYSTTDNLVAVGFSYDSVFNDGFNAGKSEGESIGYNAGVEAASNYTFFSLISAVIDAPITAFKGLFNFDFLGFNMLNFVTGLITFCFVIWIVRLIL